MKPKLKLAPNTKMELKLLVEGGNAKPGPALSQQLGSLGINLGKLISEVNKASEQYKGMKVPVIVDIDPETKSFKVSTKTPPTSELIKKELALEKGAGDSKNKIANLAVEQAIKIAKDKQNDMIVRSFKSAVKNVVATCTSLGVLVEGKEPKEASKMIDEGKFDDIISQQKTEISEEKQKVIKDQFEKIRAIIEKRIEAEEAEKAVEEAKKKEAEEAEKVEGEEAKPEEKEDDEAEKGKEAKEAPEKDKWKEQKGKK